MCNMCKTSWVVDTEWILRTSSVDDEWRSLSAAVVVVICLSCANIIIRIIVPLFPGPRGIPKETRTRGWLQPPRSKPSLTLLAWIRWSHLGRPLGCLSCCAGEGNDYQLPSPIRGALVAPEGRQSPIGVLGYCRKRDEGKGGLSITKGWPKAGSFRQFWQTLS